MTIRASKALLLFALGFYYTLVVFNNTNDYNSNLTFVRHVLLMDTTYPGNHGMWRAIHAPAIPWLFFVSIVIWEIVTGVLLWWAGIRLMRNLRLQRGYVQCAPRSWALMALTLSLLMWLSAFLSVGNEWFLMWQSKEWSGGSRRRSHVRDRGNYPAIPCDAGRGGASLGWQQVPQLRSLEFPVAFGGVGVLHAPFSRKGARVPRPVLRGRKSGYAPVG